MAERAVNNVKIIKWDIIVDPEQLSVLTPAIATTTMTCKDLFGNYYVRVSNHIQILYSVDFFDVSESAVFFISLN